MINRDKVITMTKMASYEENDGKKYSAIGRYFRSDYIGVQVIKSVVYVVIALLIITAMVVIYQLQYILEHLGEFQVLLATAKRLLFAYIVVIVMYALITYAIYSYRYSRARRKRRIYANHLKQLARMNESEQEDRYDEYTDADQRNN